MKSFTRLRRVLPGSLAACATLPWILVSSWSPGTSLVLSPAIVALVAIGGSIMIGSLVVYLRQQRKQLVLLGKSERQYRTLTEKSHDLVAEVSDELRMLYLSPNFEEVLGWNIEEYLGSSAYESIHPEDAESVGQALRKALDRGSAAVVHRLRHADGTWRYFESSARSYCKADGETRLVMIARDIGDRRRAEEALRRSEERLALALDATSDGVWELRLPEDKWGRSDVWYDLTGFKRGELERWEEEHGSIIHPDDVPVLRDAMLGHLNRAAEEYRAEFRIRHKSGEWRWILGRGRAMERDKDGNPLLLIGTDTDITASKRAEEALRVSERKYRTLVETAADAILVADAETGIILEANPSAATLFGIPSEQIVGMHQSRLYPRDAVDQSARVFGKQVRDGETITGDLEIYHSDGGRIPVNLNACVTQLGWKKVLHGIFRDVTERKRSEEEQRQLEDQLRHAQKMKAIGQLASGIAHEFNNLLFGILGNSELLLYQLDDEHGETFEKPLKAIYTCGQRAADLTQQLLAFARKRSSRAEPIDLNAVVRGSDRLLQPLLSERITLRTILCPALWPIEAGMAEIEQAVMNLAINARDAMPDGGTLTIRTGNVTFDDAYVRTHPDARPGPHAELIFEDTGCGMTDETVARIFEPFFTTKPTGEGTGLGLSAVFADITKLGGHIAVESRVEEGTVIRIYIPRATETLTESAARPADTEEECPGGNETILVCDDECFVLDSTSDLLETGGYTVLRARGGREALELASSHTGPIALLLTDVIMPEMNGPQLAKRLTRQRPEIRVLYMLGYPSDVFKAGGTKDGNIDFLKKPTTRDRLFQRVRETLALGGALR